ncbi:MULTISPECIES: lipopolysaccharide heptosyltransferase I [unclassified Xanthobacter]|uniref:lipopolysaccharide heptosyltransferase I n=1 Tax=unclassified Xanthobacter TaxID=2623496 RepID=UPI001F3F2276|nr:MULTISPECIES: lipopolysaccharide heptosyltransferase I [unclassified Xanthobacter]
MRLLVVKLSSLGDVVHTFPALTDAAAAIPNLQVDWAVEEAFAPVAALHPAVRRTICVPLRRLRKRPVAAWRSGEAAAVRRALAAEPYDMVIDAQGLMKSALVAACARGPRHGFDRSSAREPLATLLYAHTHHVPETEHMAVRIRKLFAAALGYGLEGRPADTGLRPAVAAGPPHLVFLHGTTWQTKTWPRAGWRALAARAQEAGFAVRLFAHGEAETARAKAIADGLPAVTLLPPQTLATLAPLLQTAAGVVSVDTGLGHLAAAYGVPTLGLYGPTNPRLTGLFGARVRELPAERDCAPCEKSRCRIAPDTREGPPCLADHRADAVWQALRQLQAGGD